MATTKTASTKTSPAAKKATPAKTAAPVAKKAAIAKTAAPVAKKAVAAKSTVGAPLKPITEKFTKTGLNLHLAAHSGVELKAVKAVLASLDATIFASIHKKGAGEFTLPGILKVTAQKVEAKKKRFGKDPFSGTDKWFPAKPASVRVKARPMKKLKDAAL